MSKATDDNIIKFPTRRPADRAAEGLSASGPFVPLDAEYPERVAERVAGADPFFSNTFFRLPFVTLPVEECASWGEFWDRTTMWNDEPTGSGDYCRGERYAREAIAAIVADSATPRGLEMVVDHMMERAFKRRGAGGRLCRQLSSAEKGFLMELCRIAVKAVRQKGMPQGGALS